MPYLDRMPLVDLLIRNNQRRPQAQRNWREVEALLEEIAKAAPRTVHPVVVRAMVYAEQGRQKEARDALDAARAGFPRRSSPGRPRPKS